MWRRARKDGSYGRVDLSRADVRKALPNSKVYYRQSLGRGRTLVLFKGTTGVYWRAQIQLRDDTYRACRLGQSIDSAPDGLSFEQAVAAAESWFGQPEIAAMALSERPRSIPRGLSICPIGPTYTIGHAFVDYLAWRRLSVAPRSFTTEVSNLNVLVPFVAPIPAAELSTAMLAEIVARLLKMPVRAKRLEPSLVARDAEEARRMRAVAINRSLSTLRNALLTAWENGKVDDERIWRRIKLLPSARGKAKTFLSRDECRRLLDNCVPDFRRLALGALYTGCRGGELVRLRCGHVGRDGYGITVMSGKTGRWRFVALPDEAMHWFRDLAEGRKANDLLFVRENGRPWRAAVYGLAFRRAANAAGLPHEVTFHGLRHTYASQLIQSGASLFTVAEQLGHVDAVSILRTYGHVSPQFREGEVRSRFTTLDPAIGKAAAVQRVALAQWKAQFAPLNGRLPLGPVDRRVTPGDPTNTLSVRPRIRRHQRWPWRARIE